MTFVGDVVPELGRPITQFEQIADDVLIIVTGDGTNDVTPNEAQLALLDEAADVAFPTCRPQPEPGPSTTASSPPSSSASTGASASTVDSGSTSTSTSTPTSAAAAEPNRCVVPPPTDATSSTDVTTSSDVTTGTSVNESSSSTSFSSEVSTTAG